MPVWNPWHGCTKVSPGCAKCYVYRRDAKYGKDSSVVTKTASFDMPVKKNRKKEYKLKPEDGVVYTCFTSDFFHEAADDWRPDAWRMIRERQDLFFFIVTKRPERFFEGLPEDWGDGYENVSISCTCENQRMTDKRLPVFLKLPIRHKRIIHEPMLGPINIEKYLAEYHDEIEEVSVGGESGDDARIMDFGWALETHIQCVKYNVAFSFHQTGTHFKKGEKIYHIERKYQESQAKRAGLEFQPTRL